MNDQVSGHRDQKTELKKRGYSVFTLDGVASVGTVDGSIRLYKKEPTSNEGGIVVIVCEGTRNPKRNSAAIAASDLEDNTNIYLARMTNEPHRYKVTEDVAKKVYNVYGGEGSAYRIFATGHSLGGAAAANLGATRPDLVEAAIVFNPLSSKRNSNELGKSLARANSHPNWAAKTLREKIMVSRGGSTVGGGVIVHRYVEDYVSKYNPWGLQFSWKFNKNQKMPKDGFIPSLTLAQSGMSLANKSRSDFFIVCEMNDLYLMYFFIDCSLRNYIYFSWDTLGNWPQHKMCHFIKSRNAENC